MQITNVHVLKVKESDSDAATVSWKVSRPLRKRPWFSTEHFALPPADSSLQGPWSIGPWSNAHWCLKGPCQPGVLSLPGASPGLLAQGLLGIPWPLRPYGFGRGALGPSLAWQSSRGESCGPAASFHPLTHETSFLPLQQIHTCMVQAAGSSLLHHSAVPEMKAVGTIFSAGLLSTALGFERSEFESYLCHFLAT